MEILGKLIEQSPVAGAMIIVVWMFIRSQEKTGERNEKIFRQFHEENLEARRRSQTLIESNTEVLYLIKDRINHNKH